MMLSYRSQRNLKRLGTVCLALVALAVVALLCWMLWLGRFVVYTPDGVKLDLSAPAKLPNGQLAVTPDPEPSVPVIYQDGPVKDGFTSALTQLSGYYVDLTAANLNVDTLRSQLEQLPRGTQVLVELKSFWGVAYYSSSVVTHISNNATQIDGLLEWMAERFYLIGRVPAFRDYWFGRENVAYGLARKGGPGSLWEDSQKCYWLNPGSQGTVSNLVRVATELRDKGFDEVVFSDVCFPNTDQVVFEGDRLATLNRVAADIVNTCAGENFVVAFMRSDTVLTIPEGYTRLYLSDINAADVEAMAQAAIVTDPATQVVFLAPLGDTRYDAYGVLRPLDLAVN